MLSVKQIIRKFENNIPSPDLQIILAHALRREKSYIYTFPEYKPGIFTRAKFAFFLRLYKKGYSIAAIVKSKEFYGLEFFVDKHVLIPRPETELVVDAALDRLRTVNPPVRQAGCGLRTVLIDVGTGTGCVPISIMKTLKHKNIKTFAIDISKAALKTAKKNAKRHGVDIEFLHGDLLEPIIKTLKHENIKTIIITANLPYLTVRQFNNEPSIQREPRRALVADDQTGLSLYEKLFQQITRLLIVNCLLLIEIDPRQSAPALALAKKYFPGAKVEIKKDLAGRDRLVQVIIDNPNLKQ